MCQPILGISPCKNRTLSGNPRVFVAWLNRQLRGLGFRVELQGGGDHLPDWRHWSITRSNWQPHFAVDLKVSPFIVAFAAHKVPAQMLVGFLAGSLSGDIRLTFVVDFHMLQFLMPTENP